MSNPSPRHHHTLYRIHPPRCRPALTLALTLALSSLISPPVPAQTPSPPTPAASPATLDDKNGPPFEVASIRPANHDDGRSWFGLDITNSGRLTVSSMSLDGLVHYAYGNGSAQAKVVGGPSWVSSDQYDINAKIDDSQLAGWNSFSNSERTEKIKPMLRQLLQERFHLKLHPEIRVTPVYAMVQVKGGAKLKAVDPPTDQKSLADQERQDQISDQQSPPPGGMWMDANTWKGHAIRPVALTGQIGYSSDLKTVVIDETGLTGYYDFSMKIDRGKDAPLFQDQVEEQLGLKLIPKKVPIQTWIIDAAEKPSQDGA